MHENLTPAVILSLLLMLFTILASSAAPAAWTLSLSVLTPMQLVFVSMATAGLFLVGAMVVTGALSSLFSLPARLWAWGILQGLLFFGCCSAAFVACSSLPVQIVLSVLCCGTLLLSLFFGILHRLRLPARQVVWMLAGFGGAVIVLAGAGSSFGPLSMTGLACVIAGSALTGLYRFLNIMVPLPCLMGGALSFLVSCLAAGLVLLVQGEMATLPSEGLSYGICVGLFVFAIPWIGWEMINYLFPDETGSIQIFVVPFLSLFWVSMLLDESIAWTTVAGLAVIVICAHLQGSSAGKRRVMRFVEDEEDEEAADAVRTPARTNRTESGQREGAGPARDARRRKTRRRTRRRS